MTDRARGLLYVVATPLGNLEDISMRGRRVLAEVDFIAAEDTRHTRKLLSHFKISAPPLISCFLGNEARRASEIAARLSRGERGALVTDAGTPGIADPGARIVAAAVAAGAAVVPVPGPSAMTAALSASGFPADSFLFQGFLPTGASDRAAAMRNAAESPLTLVLLESPRRISRTLRDLARLAPDRPCAIFRELTKLHEEALRGSLKEVSERVAGSPARGEYVIVLDAVAAPATRPGKEDIREAMSLQLGEGGTLAEAAREVARMLGVPRRTAYQAGLALRNKRRER